MRFRIAMFLTAGLLGCGLSVNVQAVDLHEQPIGGAGVSMDACTSSSFKNPDRLLGDAPVAEAYWQKAHAYRNAGRFEMARQQYLLALSACHTEECKNRVQRELQTVDLLIRTMR